MQAFKNPQTNHITLRLRNLLFSYFTWQIKIFTCQIYSYSFHNNYQKNDEQKVTFMKRIDFFGMFDTSF